MVLGVFLCLVGPVLHILDIQYLQLPANIFLFMFRLFGILSVI